MTLTDFKRTKYGNIALYVDGEFWKSVDSEVFVKAKLSAGTIIDEQQMEKLVQENEEKKAKQKALSMLSQRDYTANQLKKRLERHVDADAASQAVSRMEELGLVDDRDYARRYAAELYEKRLYGMLRIRQELRKKGIASEQIEEALCFLEDDPSEHIRTVLQKKYPQAGSDETIKRRAYAALLRMGYRAGDIRRELGCFCNGCDFED